MTARQGVPRKRNFLGELAIQKHVLETQFRDSDLLGFTDGKLILCTYLLALSISIGKTTDSHIGLLALTTGFASEKNLIT